MRHGKECLPVVVHHSKHQLAGSRNSKETQKWSFESKGLAKKREWREGKFPAAQANSQKHAEYQNQVKENDKLLDLTQWTQKDEIVPEGRVCRLVTHNIDTKALGENVPE